MINWNKPQNAACPDPFVDKVKCEECKHWIDRDDASKVKAHHLLSRPFDEWYCPMHKKPYDEKTTYIYPHRYYGRVEMEEDGTPVGYIKKPKERDHEPTQR